MKFDYDMLKTVCNLPIEDFRRLGTYVPTTISSGYTFIDRGAKILAVAHLDTVQDKTHFYVESYDDVGDVVFSPRLDDRLGVYLLLEKLPLFGFQYDILLCEDEELGMSTASGFDPFDDLMPEFGKRYNWMFEFDRGGSDTVLYRYHTTELASWLKQCGTQVGYGSYTDICELEDLGCKGINFATGYYSYHQINAYALIEETLAGVDAFKNFYQRFSHKHLDHVKQKYSWKSRYSYDNWGKYGKNDNEYTWDKWGTVMCPNCKGHYDSEDERVNIETFGRCSACLKFLPVVTSATCPFCQRKYTSQENINSITDAGMCLDCMDEALEDMWQRGEED